MRTVERRREMVEGIPSNAIITKKSNAPVLEICYARGWCANKNYMTDEEAAAITDIGTAFKGVTTITHFEEFQYFTGLTTIPQQAFNDTTLKTIILPPNITSIGYQAFYKADIRNTTMLIIPEGVTTISDQAFRNVNVQGISIPSTATSISNSQYNYTFVSSYIKKVNWDSPLNPNAHEYWIAGSGATEYTSNVYEVIDGILYKDNGTTIFAVPPKKPTLSISSSVTTIGNNAFFNYSGGAQLVLHEGLISIGNKSFYAARNIFGNTLIIPNTVTTIGGEAFRFTNIRLIYVPQSVETIGGSAFSNTPDKVNHIVVINKEIPPTGSNVYTFAVNTNYKWNVYVPVGYTSNYNNSNTWSAFDLSYMNLPINEIPNTFDTSSRQSIIDSLNELDAQLNN